MEPQSATLSTEQIISAATRLSLPELEQVFDRMLALKAEKKAAHLSAEEAALFTRINRGLPSELRQRVSTLRAKREEGAISDAEYEELTRLTDQAELLHAERMAALVELAKLRGASLPSLMEQLSIRFPDDV